MCTSQKLVDDLTLLKVRSAAPQPTDFPPYVAKDLLVVLKYYSAQNLYSHSGADEKLYYEIPLTNLHDEISFEVTDKRLGMLCRALGLTLVRKAPGFVVCWNEEQLVILEKYFGMEKEQ